jgi:hypothetical protein
MKAIRPRKLESKLFFSKRVIKTLSASAMVLKENKQTFRANKVSSRANGSKKHNKHFALKWRHYFSKWQKH